MQIVCSLIDLILFNCFIGTCFLVLFGQYTDLILCLLIVIKCWVYLFYVYLQFWMHSPMCESRYLNPALVPPFLTNKLVYTIRPQCILDKTCWFRLKGSQLVGCSWSFISHAQHQHQHLKSVTIQIVLTRAYFVVQKSDYSDASLLWLMTFCHRFSRPIRSDVCGPRRRSSTHGRTARRSTCSRIFSTGKHTTLYWRGCSVHPHSSLCSP